MTLPEATEVLVVHMPPVSGLGYMAHVSLLEKKLMAFWDEKSQKWHITKRAITEVLQGGSAAQR